MKETEILRFSCREKVRDIEQKSVQLTAEHIVSLETASGYNKPCFHGTWQTVTLEVKFVLL